VPILLCFSFFGQSASVGAAAVGFGENNQRKGCGEH